MVGAPVKPTGPPTPPPPPKPRPASATREGGSRRGGLPGTAIRIAVSLIIVWHFTGIFLAALSISGSSPLVMNIAQTAPMQWYLDALYLNQGHSFFAPDVGPGHILRYELFDQSNNLITQGTLPDKKEHWPRLLYHRHMMLADQADVPANEHMDVKRAALEAYGRHILRLNRRAQTVRVQLYAHWPLPSFYAQEGRAVGYQHLMQEMNQQGQAHKVDEQGYEMVGEAVQRRSDLPPEPDPPPEPEPEPKKQAFAPGAVPNPNLNWRGDRPYVAGRRPGGAPR